jgi:hypothetical protein
MILNKDKIISQATKINEQNMALLALLKEHFGEDFPIFMDAVSEEELPKNNMSYIFIETGNYVVSDEHNKAMRETVTVNYFSEGRPNPTLDRLMIVLAGQSVRLKMVQSTQETIVLDNTSRLIGLFTCDFSRAVLKGCM